MVGERISNGKMNRKRIFMKAILVLGLADSKIRLVFI
jgi:hypothetical protein